MIQIAEATERTLIRTIAGASRKLDEDLDLSDLQAIDRLQDLDRRFREHWVGHPWLVLEDRHVLPADMPVQNMLDQITKHGRPIGIVGVAWLTRRRETVFRMMFRKDEKNRKTVEGSAKDAEEMVKKVRQMGEEQLAAKVRAMKLHERIQK